VGRRTIRARCERALDGIDVPRPFDVDSLCAAVSARRGRPLRLLPKPVEAGPCGIWIAFEHVDVVYYEAGTSTLHKNHIIAHELGHLLCGHNASGLESPDLLATLFPNLSRALVASVMGRTTYSTVEEQEAELIATLLLERSGLNDRPSVPAADRRLDGLAAALGGESR
jgi:hypothetical protein